jgi:YbbR domain-containing protein
MYYLNMWFRENLGLKIISVLLAVCLWAYVMVRENPVVEVTIAKATIELAPPPGLTVVECNPETAELRINGPRGVLARLSQAQLMLTVDLTGQEAGTHVLLLRGPHLPRGVTLVSLAPTTVRVTLDKTETETRQITVKLSGEPAPGFVFSPPSATPGEAKVTGAASLLARVSRLVAEADASGVGAATELTKVPVIAVDDQGDTIAGLRVNPAEVSVTVAVTGGSETSKTVPVRPQVGKAAEGYQVKDIVAHPEEVTLTGSPDALARVDSVVTEVIPLEGVTSTVTYKVKVVLPEGVKREGDEPIEVTVTVAKVGEGEPAGTAPGSAPAERKAAPPPGAKPRGGPAPAPSGAASPSEGKASPPRAIPVG